MTLKLSITMIVFNYIRRGLFERDKLTISTLITLTLQEQDGEIEPEFMSCILKVKNPLFKTKIYT